jgi:hypothetical protein
VSAQWAQGKFLFLFSAKSSEICVEITLFWAKGKAALSARD